MADYYSSASSLEWDSASTGDISDVDSAYDEIRSTHTQSVASSVYDFQYEHGRRYHAYKDGQYKLPNDETEQDRLDLQHHLFRLTLDGALYFAPLPSHIQRALDVGCGTGIWAIDFADQHPEIQVLGVDLSPIQPDQVPANCHFRVDDIEADWIHSESFDLIHSRAMIGALRDWPRFFEQALHHLTPGGILELHDLCFPPRCDDPEAAAQSKSIAWANAGISGTQKLGMDAAAPLRWVEHLRAVGFVDIHVKWVNWPIGPWAKGKKNKVLGRWAMADMQESLKAPVKLFTSLLGWSVEQYEVTCAEVRKEYRDQKIHLYLPVCFCWARKPYDSEVPKAQNGEPTADRHEDAPPIVPDPKLKDIPVTLEETSEDLDPVQGARSTAEDIPPEHIPPEHETAPADTLSSTQEHAKEPDSELRDGRTDTIDETPRVVQEPVVITDSTLAAVKDSDTPMQEVIEQPTEQPQGPQPGVGTQSAET